MQVRTTYHHNHHATDNKGFGFIPDDTAMIATDLRSLFIEDIERSIKRALDAGMPESEVRWLVNRAFRDDVEENPPIFTARRFGDAA